MQNNLLPLPALTIVTGHYGSGKTNLSLNLAIDAAAAGQQVTLVDLDIVNPYFRSSDYETFLADKNIRVVAPNLAGSTLDTPSLSGRIYTAIDGATSERPVILDVGGDDAGATALGRFAKNISAHPYRMIYVVNQLRGSAQEVGEVVQILAEIEEKSHLTATDIVNNSHLKDETTEALILASLPFAEDVSMQLGLPVVCTTVPVGLFSGKDGTSTISNAIENVYPVSVYVRTPWEV